MQKIKLEAQIERKKRFTLLAGLGIFAIILLSIFQLILSNRLATYGEKLSLLNEEERALRFDNEIFAKEIAFKTSITYLFSRAHDLSLGPATNFIVVNQAESVALAP